MKIDESIDSVKSFSSFRKIITKRYFLVVSIFVLLIVGFGISYSYLSLESGWHLASELIASKLYYTVTVDGGSKTINIAANSGTTYHDIEITSLNDINTRYAITYNSNVEGVIVQVSSLSVNAKEGIIGLYSTGTTEEKTKTIRVAITNNTNSAATITFEAAGGYTWNPENQITLKDNHVLINGIAYEAPIDAGLAFTSEVNGLLSCTPTASSPCLFKENANNYLTYAGKTWRVIGTYLISGEQVLKLILDGNLENTATYSGASSVLTSFYNGLSNTALIRTSSPFTCTGTTTLSCSGSANIGSISKSEYDLIGGVNSYLYTKPDENYWTSTQYHLGTSRGSIVGNSATEGYVRPSIYLISSVIKSGGDGSKNNPYIPVEGVKITYNVNGGSSCSYVYIEKGTAPGDLCESEKSYKDFGGWYTDSNYGTQVTGDTVLNSDTTLVAKWDPMASTIHKFYYTGDIQEFVVPRTGTYKLRVFGARGGAGNSYGGNGGYSEGFADLTKGQVLYVVVGGEGTTADNSSTYTDGGYNGGGAANYGAGTGGGATHIAKSSGLLSTFASKTSDLYIVAGGGGGAGKYGTTTYGGYGGSSGQTGGHYDSSNQGGGGGATQTAGGAAGTTGSTAGTAGSFGQGGKGGYNSSSGSGGGGGGYYGGGGGSGRNGGGGGGSNRANTGNLDNHVNGGNANYANGYAEIILMYDFHEYGVIYPDYATTSFITPADGYYYMEVTGAAGGTANSSYAAGRGGAMNGYIYMNANEKVYIYVGTKGSVTSTAANQTAAGGYNGGGYAKNYASGTGRIAGSGGGASDIRYFDGGTPDSSNLTWDSTLGLNSRILVAGGGGGSWYYSSNYYGSGGSGGFLVGGGASGKNNSTTLAATGGTQNGTSFGAGVNAPSGSRTGGGGGYFGGNIDVYAAGGGSNFASGYAGVNAITSASSRTLTNNTLHYSGKYFLGVTGWAGLQSGNGDAYIAYVGSDIPKTTTRLEGVRYIKDCINGNSKNSSNHWVEIQAIKDGLNVAKGKSVTGTHTQNSSYPYTRITDGIINSEDANYAMPSTSNTNQCVTVDLADTYDLDEISIWHFWKDGRTYYKNVVSVSSDNSTWVQIMNPTRAESSQGNRYSTYGYGWF